MVAFATQVKRRRGTTAQNDAFTGAEGEIVVDTQKHTLRVHDGLTQGGFEIARTEDINELNQLILSSVVPAGIVSAFAGTTPPSGWLKCDGSAISRTTYSALFDVIGTTYGAGDGSTTFNLPNLQVGRVPVGMDGAYVGQSTKGVLPNITAYWGSTIAQDQSYGGAVVQDPPSNSAWWSGATSVPRSARFSFDAQRVNAIYGSGWFDGTKVIPASVGMTYCIKY